MKFYQGATYNLPFYLTFNKSWVAPADIEDIEFYFSDIIKKYSTNEILYEDNGKYIVNITEEDTLKISYKKKHNLQVRVIFLGGDVKFTDPVEFLIEKTNYSNLKE